MSYKLWYFPLRGRGEQVRLFLHALGQPFEDMRVRREQFMQMKGQGPGLLAFGSLPLLEDGDFKLVQGPVILGYLARQHGVAPQDLRAAARADAITLGAEDLRSKFFSLLGEGAEEKQRAFLDGDWKSRWLPSLEGLLALNGSTGFFVGDHLTHADIAVWDALDGVLARIPGAALDGCSGLQHFRDRIQGLPALSSYLAQRA